MSNNERSVSSMVLAREAQDLIQQAAIKIRDAAYEAGREGNPEVDKVFGSIDQTLAGVIGLLISVPRLKG